MSAKKYNRIYTKFLPGIILVVLMPLASLIPMTTLAAVLLVVAWNMADWTSFFHLCKTAPKSDMIVLVATFFLTVFFDLVVAIEVGVVLAALLFMKRMAETADVTAWKYADEPDVTPGEAEKMRDIPHSSPPRCVNIQWPKKSS